MHFALAQGQLTVMAASALALWTGARALRRWPTTREATAWLVLVAGVTLAVRWIAPWGPAQLAEARRLDVLYATHPQTQGLFLAVPSWLDLLASAGLAPSALVRWLGPIGGLACALAAVWLARTAGLVWRWAGLAGLLVALWPAHIHYSASTSMEIVAGALLTLSLAVARDPQLQPSWQVSGTASLAALVAVVRPECRATLPAVAMATLAGHWTWRRRAAAAVLWLALCAGVLAELLSQSGLQRESRWSDHRNWLLQDLRTAPVMWCWLAMAGLVAGSGARLHRASLAVATAALLAAYLLATEPNPSFGLWRYYMTLWPLAAVAAAGAVAAAAARWPALQRDWLPLALTATTLLPWAPLWLRQTDLQLEFAAAADGASEALRGDPLILLPDGKGNVQDGADHVATVLLAAALRTGARYHHAPGEQGVDGKFGRAEVRSLEAWLDAPTAHRAVVAWWGAYLAPATRAKLMAVGTWRPLHEQTAAVRVQLPHSNRNCPAPRGRGREQEPCVLTVGWRTLQR